MPMSPTRSFNQKRRRENALRERTLPFPPSAPSHELILPCTFDRGVRTQREFILIPTHAWPRARRDHRSASRSRVSGSAPPLVS